MAVPKQQHLQKRGSVWYFGRRIPVELLSVVGKRWMFDSLKTKDLKVAQKRRNNRLVKLDAERAALKEHHIKHGSCSEVPKVAKLSPSKGGVRPLIKGLLKSTRPLVQAASFGHSESVGERFCLNVDRLTRWRSRLK
jgi:hypothetical protein